MTSSLADITRLDDELLSLESGLNETSKLAAAFTSELRGIAGGLSEAETQSSSFSNSLNKGMKRAFDDLIFEGDKLSDVMQNLARSMINRGFSDAVTPVTDAVSSSLSNGLTNLIGGLIGFSDGGAFSNGRVTAFAKGGVIDTPTGFPMRGGVGLMGEAGPEAIMPLSRGTDGSLGVRTNGAQRPVTINMNISTPDAQSFVRSRSQISAKIAQAVSAGQKNL